MLSRFSSLERFAKSRMSSMVVTPGSAKNNGVPHLGQCVVDLSLRSAQPTIARTKNTVRIIARTLSPNVLHQARQAPAPGNHERRNPASPACSGWAVHSYLQSRRLWLRPCKGNYANCREDSHCNQWPVYQHDRPRARNSSNVDSKSKGSTVGSGGVSLL